MIVNGVQLAVSEDIDIIGHVNREIHPPSVNGVTYGQLGRGGECDRPKIVSSVRLGHQRGDNVFIRCVGGDKKL